MNKILLIEDDKIILEMYQDKFIHEGFEVFTAHEGQEGFEKMKAAKPDLVLLDLIMPKVNGFEFLKLVKADLALKQIPIFVLTNIFADTQDLVKEWGVANVFLKSNYTPEDILLKVKQTIQQKTKKL